jgi:hypothetical protein
MENLEFLVKASRDGEPLRTIANGTRQPNGELSFRGDIAQPIPHDLFHKLDRQLAELPMSVGGCEYRDGYVTFQLYYRVASELPTIKVH